MKKACFWVSLVLFREIESNVERIDLLSRVRRCMDAHRLTWLGYRLDDERLQVLVSGGSPSIWRMIHGIRRGTAHTSRSWASRQYLDLAGLHRVDDLGCALAQLHRQMDGSDPLSNRWTSHRDLMGLRQAAYFDARDVRRRVNAEEVNLASGGAPVHLRAGSEGRQPSLDRLLYQAGDVYGTSGADRKVFSLFAHMAKQAGYSNSEVADALMLSDRRVRQLLAAQPVGLPIGLAVLGDERLAA